METKVLDVQKAAEYLVSLGFSAATDWTIRGLIASGELRAVKLSRRFYVSTEDLDSYVSRALSGQFRGSRLKVASKAR
jgi:excisionase family DNA binding protein